jgi:hypothetical protein
VTTTFAMATFAWIFFRAENLSHALQYISGIFSKSLFSTPTLRPKDLFLIIIIFMLIEWLGREQKYAIEKLGLNWESPFRYAMYYVIIIVIIYFSGKEQQFIYFQF